MYLNDDSREMDRMITDFLFHYFHDVGMLDFSNGLSYYVEPNIANFTTEMKNALIEIAKFVIGEEIYNGSLVKTTLEEIIVNTF